MKLVQPIELCASCRGTGWEMVEGKGVKPCSQCKTKAPTLALPPRFDHATLTNYIPQGNKGSTSLSSQRWARRECELFVEKFQERDSGLLLLGPCGVGKTHLAIAILKAITEQHGTRCIFSDTRKLLKDIQATYNSEAKATEQSIVEPLITTEVLLLDEIGVSNPSTWVVETLFHLVNTRYLENKITLFTSNYTDTSAGETLTDRIGTRLRSRLYEMCQTILIEGTDFRQTMNRALKPVK